MKNKQDLLEILFTFGLKYLSKFEVSENRFKLYINKKFNDLKLTIKLSEKKEIIDLTVNKMRKLNYINDMRYSELRCNKMFNDGNSKKFIRFKLKDKGVEENIINKVIKDTFNEKIDEVQSALIYIKKKRIGLFCNKIVNVENEMKIRNKWLGTLARKGFPYEIAKNALDIEDLSEAEKILNRTH